MKLIRSMTSSRELSIACCKEIQCGKWQIQMLCSWFLESKSSDSQLIFNFELQQVKGGGVDLEEDVLMLCIAKTSGDSTNKAFSDNYNFKSFSLLIFWTVVSIKHKGNNNVKHMQLKLMNKINKLPVLSSSINTTNKTQTNLLVPKYICQQTPGFCDMST